MASDRSWLGTRHQWARFSSATTKTRSAGAWRGFFAPRVMKSSRATASGLRAPAPTAGALRSHPDRHPHARGERVRDPGRRAHARPRNAGHRDERQRRDPRRRARHARRRARLPDQAVRGANARGGGLGGAQAAVARRARRPTRSAGGTEHAPWLLGSDAALLPALSLLAQVADTRCTVLITGESGTGKELAARSLHAGSSRAGKPFVAVNCAAIPANLVESELFGHAKGSFTGASSARIGRFAQADGGTILLDEIGEMEIGVQAKLLRLIQDGELYPVGEETRDPHRRAHPGRDQPKPRARGRRGAIPRRSLLAAGGDPGRAAVRCASAPPTSCSCASTSSGAPTNVTGAAWPASSAQALRPSRPTAGPGTSASSRTSSSGW